MHFLILKTSSLGDIIHAFYALNFLRKKFPTSKIDWIVEKSFAPLLTAHPFVNQVITVDTKKWRKGKNLSEIKDYFRIVRKEKYDAVLDLQGNIKSSLLLPCIRSKNKIGFGKRTVSEWPNLFFTNFHVDPPKGLNIREDYLYPLQSYFNDFIPFHNDNILLKLNEEEQSFLNSFHFKEHNILVCPGSNWSNKQLSFESLVKILQNMDGSFFFAWGSETEKDYGEKLAHHFPNSQVLPKLSLPLLQNFMDRMDLVISMDSLPLHLAGTTKVKTLSFFGPSLAKKYAPVGKQHQYYQGTCPYNITFEKRCPKLRTCKTGSCIKKLI